MIDENIKGIEMEKKSDKSKDDLVLLVTLAGLAITAMKNNQIKIKLMLLMIFLLHYLSQQSRLKQHKTL